MWNALPRAVQEVYSGTSFKNLYLELLASKSQFSNSPDLVDFITLVDEMFLYTGGKYTLQIYALSFSSSFSPSPLIHFIFLIVGTLEKTICLLEILL